MAWIFVGYIKYIFRFLCYSRYYSFARRIPHRPFQNHFSIGWNSSTFRVMWPKRKSILRRFRPTFALIQQWRQIKNKLNQPWSWFLCSLARVRVIREQCCQLSWWKKREQFTENKRKLRKTSEKIIKFKYLKKHFIVKITIKYKHL